MRINFRRTLDNMIRIILNNKEIVIPIFKALDLNSELSRDLVREASATALSADTVSYTHLTLPTIYSV